MTTIEQPIGFAYEGIRSFCRMPMCFDLSALEEKTFLPVGAVKEVTSDFELICGTNRDLIKEVEKGEFREDLFARINLWTFYLPGLRDRPEDIEPNIEYELEEFEKKTGSHVKFNKEARERFLFFATSPQAKWSANFRDLNAAITRMATLAPAGRINLETVEEEIGRLTTAWAMFAPGDDHTLGDIFTPAQLAEIDPFERAQLSYVIKVCWESRSLSDAGRKLFTFSREKKKRPNDADRLRKYLARFDIDWQTLQDVSFSRRV
jgi:transcriptional regulatory protein RtcR